MQGLPDSSAPQPSAAMDIDSSSRKRAAKPPRQTPEQARRLDGPAVFQGSSLLGKSSSGPQSSPQPRQAAQREHYQSSMLS